MRKSSSVTDYLLKILVVLVLFTSCDKEFSDAGSSLLDDDEFDYETKSFDVSMENIFVGPVETTNLPVNSLGSYNTGSTLFGEIDNSFVTQLELQEENPTIGNNPTISKVMLYVPYYARVVSGGYELDSIYGSGELDLSVYESKYYMDGNDNNDRSKAEKFYSDDFDKIDNYKGDSRLNNSSEDFSQNTKFSVSDASVSVDEDNEVTYSPGMYLELDRDFFQEKLFTPLDDSQNMSPELESNNAFKKHLRGLFFVSKKADVPGNNGLLMNLNFSKGEVIVFYDEDDEDDATQPKVSKTLKLSLGGHTANFFKTNTVAPINDKIVLKGGDGAIAELELFTNPGDLEELQSSNWLINEANLVFYVDQDEIGSADVKQPLRLVVYDGDNNKSLVDYNVDFTTSSDFKRNKFIFGGIVEEIDGVKQYKVKITRHINEVMKDVTSDDSLNVKLRVALTDNITDQSFTMNKTNNDSIPGASVYSPFGTVLNYKSTLTPEEIAAGKKDNKLKLEIFYSTPKQ